MNVDEVSAVLKQYYKSCHKNHHFHIVHYFYRYYTSYNTKLEIYHSYFYCRHTGEIRVNEQLILACMHTLMAREHNVVAKGLAEVNPHWDDETLYQEARRINIAIIQHITYNEFLPILLGKDVMEKFGLILQKEVNFKCF